MTTEYMTMDYTSEFIKQRQAMRLVEIFERSIQIEPGDELILRRAISLDYRPSELYSVTMPQYTLTNSIIYANECQSGVQQCLCRSIKIDPESVGWMLRLKPEQVSKIAEVKAPVRLFEFVVTC